MIKTILGVFLFTFSLSLPLRAEVAERIKNSTVAADEDEAPSLVDSNDNEALGTPSKLDGELPVVRVMPPELQSKIQCLNSEYLVFSPAVETNSKLPLVIFLHGAGGVGDDIMNIKVKGKPREVMQGIQKFQKGPAIVVAPQCLKKCKNGERGIWTPEDLNLFLEHLKETLPVDERRIYLSGISMGGYGTWAWAAHNPEHFAAAAPIVGGIGREGPGAVTPDFEQWARNLAQIPVYAFVGALDKTVPPERSERMVAAIQKAGGREAKLKVYPNEGHGAARAVVVDQEYYDWLFSQVRRPDTNPTPVVEIKKSKTAKDQGQ